MLIAVLALFAALQSQTPAPVVQVATLNPAPPSAPAAAPAPAPAPAESAPEPEPEAEAEPAAEEAPTRQVCRFVEMPGRRFPVRRCRTVPAGS
ncbi:hypothetical protein [Brevundimonas sp.]|uniref:hypothetical protein n=1 Tax=Brevundimonas sp. TaxID=1871086 RepID=UPI002ED89A6E